MHEPPECQRECRGVDLVSWAVLVQIDEDRVGTLEVQSIPVCPVPALAEHQYVVIRAVLRGQPWGTDIEAGDPEAR